MGLSLSYPSAQPSLNLDFINTQALDPRITFTRSTTAVAYDAKSSTIAEQNLLLQSQNFGTTWTASNITLGTSTTAPDGTSTGTTLTSSNSSLAGVGVYEYSASYSGTGSTYSVYGKAGTSNFLGICNNSTGGVAYAIFNLGTGAVSSSASCTASITSVGNGWYRCVMANVSNGGGGFFMLTGKDADPASNPWTNGTWASGNTIQIWGAQLEQRSSATAYNATTTTALTNYIPTLQTYAINAPRLDYDPVTRFPLGLLIEQSSTNLLTYSQDFSNGAWSGIAGATRAANTIIAPDGSLTGNTINSVNSTNGGYARQYFTYSAIPYTASIYVKKGNWSYFGVRIAGAFSANLIPFINLDTGVTNTNGISGAALLATSVGNGWYKVSLTYTTTAGATVLDFGMVDSSGNQVTNLGAGQYVFVWGAQLEALAFPTSYIATTSAQVTRAKDSAVITGTNFSSWFNNQQGTFYCNATPFGNTSNVSFSLSASFGTYLYWSYYQGVNVYNNGGNQAGNALYTVNTEYKSANSYVQGGLLSSSYNGNSVSTAPIPSNSPFSQLAFFDLNSPGLVSCSHIKKLVYYPTALPSSQLQTLTGY